MKKLIGIILLSLVGCFTHNEPPPDREPNRFLLVDIAVKTGDKGDRYRIYRQIRGEGRGVSVREAIYIHNMLYPNDEIVHADGWMAIPENR